VSWDQHRKELPFRRTHRASKASSDVTVARVLSRILSLGRKSQKVMADVGPVGIACNIVVGVPGHAPTSILSFLRVVLRQSETALGFQ